MMRNCKYIFLIFSLFFFVGCEDDDRETEYPEIESRFDIKRSYNDVWSDVLDFFLENNLSFDIVDRESGLIVTEKAIFDHSYYLNDRLTNNYAYVIVQYEHKKDKLEVECSWSIRVKKTTEEGVTSLSVHLTSPVVYIYREPTEYADGYWAAISRRVVSTGSMEKEIYNWVR